MLGTTFSTQPGRRGCLNCGIMISHNGGLRSCPNIVDWLVNTGHPRKECAQDVRVAHEALQERVDVIALSLLRCCGEEVADDVMSQPRCGIAVVWRHRNPLCEDGLGGFDQIEATAVRTSSTVNQRSRRRPVNTGHSRKECVQDVRVVH